MSSFLFNLVQQSNTVTVVRLSVCLSVRMSVCLSVCLSLSVGVFVDFKMFGEDLPSSSQNCWMSLISKT